MEDLPEDGLKEEVKTESTKWRCSECHFDNYHLLGVCEICESSRPDHDVSKKRQLSPATISCNNKECKADNPLDVQYCILCAHPLFEEKPRHLASEKPRINKDLIKCPHCSLQNLKQNKKCLNCNTLLLPPHPKPYAHSVFGGTAQHCPNCGVQLKLIIGFGGSKNEVCSCQLQDIVIQSGICTFCDAKIASKDWKNHKDRCEKRLLFFDKTKNPTFDRCTDLQIDTIRYMQLQSQKYHNFNKKAILTRIRKIGFTEEDLDNLHHYIAHYAPIIVHMRATNFVHYAKDTHYRNAFEIHKGMHMGGGGRVQWEDRMFSDMHHEASPFERVKYGTMNFTNDPKGVGVCQGYGLSYFLLKPHLRDRCTITDMDSASATATIGTFRFINHILVKLSDSELKSAFEGSLGKQMLSNVIGVYKEIQIHGPLQFSRDISRVYICKQEITDTNTKKLIQEFCLKNKLEWEQFQSRNMGPNIHAFRYGSGQTDISAAPTRFIGESHQKKQRGQEGKEEEAIRGRKPPLKKRSRR